MMHGEWFFACLRYDFCNARPQRDISSQLEIYPIIVIGDILGFCAIFLLHIANNF